MKRCNGFLGMRSLRLLAIFVLLVLAGCGGNSTQSPSASPSANATTSLEGPTIQVTTVPPEPTNATPAGPVDVGSTIPQNSVAPVATGYPVKVFFSKYPDSLSNIQAVFPVNRISPTIMVGTFAIQLLIAGPTPKEWDNGYFSELNSILTGPSACAASRPTGGLDFTLVLDKRGTHSEVGTATLQFCRAILSPGIGADARITSEITATLKQFPSVKKVVILTKDGHCFGDGSGKDSCLR